MTFEREEASDNGIVVDHFHSLVVEVIAMLSLESKSERQTIAIGNSLSKESKLFFQTWKHESTIDFMQLLNFLIPCPYFHDLKLFLVKLTELSDEEFLYHLFGEELERKIIFLVLDNPVQFIKNNENIIWDSDLKQDFTIHFIQKLPVYRSALVRLLEEASESSVFTKALDQKIGMIKEAMNKVKDLPMKPITLAQYIMGKNFRRVSDYRIYYFIPSFFFTYKMRIFNTNMCIVFYNCSSQITDDLQQSKDLDVKLKAIADPNRLILLRMLSGQKLYGARLAEYLGVTTATVSHHLDLLKKADFIIEEKVGTIKYFTSHKEKLDLFFEELKNFIHI